MQLTPASITPHPSRSAPRCVDCLHLDIRPGDKDRSCLHPSTAVDVVTGKPMISVHAMRADRPHRGLVEARIVPCGPAGSFFVRQRRDGDRDALSVFTPVSANRLREELMKQSPADSAALKKRLGHEIPPPHPFSAKPAPDWTYQAPNGASAQPMHRYYRAKFMSTQPMSNLPDAAYLTLFRYDKSPHSTLVVELPNHDVYAPAELDRASMLTLRDALNDALHDIDALPAAIDRADPAAITSAEVQRVKEFILSSTQKAAR